MNSFHFISNPKYPKIFQDIENNFDYIIFDTAPLLSVADTSAILKLSDINLLVIRHEVTKNLNSRNRYSVYTTYRKK